MNLIKTTNRQLSAPGWMMAVIILITVGNFTGWLGVGLHTDEAYYWVWSQRLDWGYFDHPPMIAWMVRIFTEVFGDNRFAIRLPAVLAWAVSSYIVFLLACDLFKSRKTGWLAVLVFISLPIYQIGFHVIGPDSPLMLFTALTCLFVYRALELEDGRAEWIKAGIAVGLAMLGKYTAVLLPAAIFLSLILSPMGRRHLLSPWPWLAGFIAAAFFVPVVIWNAQNDWASFLFQWGHGTATNKGFSVSKIETYILQQMSSVLPWVFLGMIAASIKLLRAGSIKKIPSLIFLIVMFWFPVIFFAITGSMSKSMHNWPVIAYFSGSILLAGWLGQWLEISSSDLWRYRLTKYSVLGSALIAMLLINLVRFPYWANYSDKQVLPQGSAVAAVWGWGQLGNAAKDIIESESHWNPTCRVRVVADYNNAHLGYYHAAGQLAVQLGNADLVSVDPVKHFQQYNLWQKTYQTNGRVDCLIMVGPSYLDSLPATIAGPDKDRWPRRSIINIYVPDKSIQRYAFYGPP